MPTTVAAPTTTTATVITRSLKTTTIKSTLTWGNDTGKAQCHAHHTHHEVRAVGRKIMNCMHELQGHFLDHLLVQCLFNACSMLRNAHFTCAHSLACSISRTQAHGKVVYDNELNESKKWMLCRQTDGPTNQPTNQPTDGSTDWKLWKTINHEIKNFKK